MRGTLISLRMLGSTELRREGRPMNSFLGGSKRLGMLAYLTLVRPRGFRRRVRAPSLIEELMSFDSMVFADPLFDPVRDDPRFEEPVQRKLDVDLDV